MIITIDRQCGCGGHKVGVLLAKKMELELYDKKKLMEESKKIGKFEENSDFFDEKSVNSLLYSIAMNYSEKNPMTASFQLVKELTHGKDFVMIGRCGNIIYQDVPDVTTVYLHADLEHRIKRIMERDHLSEKEARKQIRETDKKREQFHRSCTSTPWSDSNQYQLSIDTGLIGIEESADLIIDYINLKKKASDKQ